MAPSINFNHIIFLLPLQRIYQTKTDTTSKVLSWGYQANQMVSTLRDWNKNIQANLVIYTNGLATWKSKDEGFVNVIIQDPANSLFIVDTIKARQKILHRVIQKTEGNSGSRDGRSADKNKVQCQQHP